MKKAILLSIAILSVHFFTAQTDGISYQAVIIDNSVQEIPGVDISGNYLAEEEVSLRFTIVTGSESIDYQEVHDTQTDAFGMVNLIIGQGEVTGNSPGAFTQIDWDGDPKDMTVEIGYQGEEFQEFSQQPLLFVPYAFHRNITATGTLTVDEETILNADLTVANAAFTLLSGDLTVLGDAEFLGTTTFGNILVLDTSDLQGVLNVGGIATMENLLNAQGQVTIDVALPNAPANYDNYPLRVEGSSQGIAVKTTASTPDGSNNFITFFDSNENAVGRIEGQIASEVYTSGRYIYENAVLVANGVAAAAGLIGASSSSTICVGLGGCVTAPVPSLVVSAGVNSATAAANLVAYNIFAFENLGVTYESGSADYAEWLERENSEEEMSFGDIVAVNGGLISKESEMAERYMVISHKPAVLGNMPKEEDLPLHEKVAFMGQVPVKVKGKVEIGDYILPSGNNDGFGIGIHPDEMTLKDYEKIVGTAWSATQDDIADYVNVAIGMNQNDLLTEVMEQEKAINQMRDEIAELRAMVTGEERVPQPTQASESAEYRTLSAEEMVHEVSREELEAALDQFRDQLVAQGIDINVHPYYGPVFNDPVMRERVLGEMKILVDQQHQQALDYNRSKGY